MVGLIQTSRLKQTSGFLDYYRHGLGESDRDPYLKAMWGRHARVNPPALSATKEALQSAQSSIPIYIVHE